MHYSLRKRREPSVCYAVCQVMVMKEVNKQTYPCADRTGNLEGTWQGRRAQTNIVIAKQCGKMGNVLLKPALVRGLVHGLVRGLLSQALPNFVYL